MDIYTNIDYEFYPWYFNGKSFTQEDFIKYEGFVYLLTNTYNDKKYLGKKTFWKRRKGKRKVESDWKFYFGSCKQVHEDIKLYGHQYFRRDILSIHKTKGSMNYTEISELFKRDILQNSQYYNQSIGNYRNVNLTESVFSPKNYFRTKDR